MHYHQYGLFVGNSGVTEGVIGDQLLNGNVAPGNRFQGYNNGGNFPYSGFGLYRYVLSNPPPITFQVNPNSGSDYYEPTSGSNNAGVSAIIVDKQNGTTAYSCPGACEVLSPNEGEESLQDPLINQAEAIIADTAIAGTTDEVNQWSMKKNLYEFLQNNDAIQDSSIVISEFVDSIAASNIDKLIAVKELMQQIGDTTLSQISRQSKMDSSISLLNTIVTEKGFEENAKQVYTIYLQTVLSDIDTFTSDQLGTIFNIAIQCPYFGGPAVYQARSLYSLLNDSIFYNDDATCSESANLLKNEVQSGASSTSNVLSVYPNPSTGLFNVSYVIHNDLLSELRIVNVLNQIVFNQSLSSHSGLINLNLSLLPSAVYTIEIIQGAKPIVITKLIKTE